VVPSSPNRATTAHEVDLAAHKVRHRRPGALVRHFRERRADRLHEKQSAELRGSTDAHTLSWL
jgi:hypothetical protein